MLYPLDILHKWLCPDRKRGAKLSMRLMYSNPIAHTNGITADYVKVVSTVDGQPYEVEYHNINDDMGIDILSDPGSLVEIYSKNLTRIGLKGLSSLEIIDCPDLSILGIIASVLPFTSLNLTNCPKLKQLDIDANYPFTSVDISACTNIEVLEAGGCNFTELDLSKLTKLRSVSIKGIRGFANPVPIFEDYDSAILFAMQLPSFTSGVHVLDINGTYADNVKAISINKGWSFV